MISLCTMCMNRHTFLEETLSTWLKFPFDEIVIVDWSSTPKIQVISTDERIRLLRVDGREYWMMNTARNTSIDNSHGDVIMLIDCDVKIMKDPTKIDLHESFYHGDNHKEGLVGTCLMKREWYVRVGGFNENITCYGTNTREFHQRLKHLGLGPSKFEAGMLEHINHSMELRLANIGVGSYHESIQKSLRQSTQHWNDTSVKEMIEVMEIRR